jgi:Zn-dependent protease
VLLFSLSFHESAHAWAAWAWATTPRPGKGVSASTLVHIDPLGTVLLPLVMMLSTGSPSLGWAKPTPTTRPTSGVTGALPAGTSPWPAALSNLILAVPSRWPLRRCAWGDRLQTDGPYRLLMARVQINVLLAVFNLVPPS